MFKIKLTTKFLFYFYVLSCSLISIFGIKPISLLDVAVITGINYLFFSLLISNYLRGFVFFLFVILFVSLKIYEVKSGMSVSDSFVASVYGTAPAEFVVIFKWYWYCFLAILLLICLLFYIISCCKRVKIFKFYMFFSITTLLLFGKFAFREPMANVVNKWRDTQPVMFFRVLFDIYVHERQVDPLSVKKVIFPDSKNIKKSTDIILVIGESARGDRFSLNGYKKETNPLLSKQRNLVSFANAFSCGNSTNFSVPCMLNYADSDNFKFPIKFQDIVSVFNDLNFNTAFISSQYIARNPGIHYSCKISNYCEYDVPGFDIVLNQKIDTLIDKDKNNFIIVHYTGSHFDYNDRVPKNFTKFNPICKDKPFNCDSESLDNSYDNTIFYTDFVINDLIEKFKNRNAIIVYSSDHGEALGEKGLYGHGNIDYLASKEQKHIGFMIWVSDLFIKNYDINVNKLKAKKDNKISHDNVFFSILGSVKLIDKDHKLNLFNNDK